MCRPRDSAASNLARLRQEVASPAYRPLASGSIRSIFKAQGLGSTRRSGSAELNEARYKLIHRERVTGSRFRPQEPPWLADAIGIEDSDELHEWLEQLRALTVGREDQACTG